MREFRDEGRQTDRFQPPLLSRSAYIFPISPIPIIPIATDSISSSVALALTLVISLILPVDVLG